MPVFVDATGRRRRRMRRIAYAVGAACLTYTGLVVASVVGHATRPGALALLPAPTNHPQSVARQTQPPKPTLSGKPVPPGVPVSSGVPRQAEQVPMRLHSGQAHPTPTADRQPTQAPPRGESTPAPTPTTTPPPPTQPPYQPWPQPIDRVGPAR